MPVEVKNLTHVYMPGTPFETRALDNVSFVINDGEFVGIIGHTGSGKSTLIAHLNALIRPHPGTVFINGTDIGQKDARLIDIRREVGLVFQYPEYQLFEETVEKDVEFGPKNLGLSPEECQTRAERALVQVGISKDLFARSPFELSGGQKRRVAIAGVLAMEPKMLILDEPAAGLDPAGREEILSLIQNVHASGVTVVMVSHSMDDVARFCTRLIVLNHGKIAFDDVPRKVFSNADALYAMGLDVPESVKLAELLRKNGFVIEPGLYRMEEIKRAILTALRGDGGC